MAVRCGFVCDCDDDSICLCACANCAPVGGLYTKNAPCCFSVTIAGLSNGTCLNCLSLNRTYYLAQDSGCTWTAQVSCHTCAAESCTLTVIDSAGDYILRVTMGTYTWEKNYGASRPACCELSAESIPLVSSGSSDCSGSPTCSVSAGCPGVTATPCSSWIKGYVPNVSLDFSAVTATNTAYCDNCSNLPGIYVCSASGNNWLYSYNPFCTGGAGAWTVGAGLYLLGCTDGVLLFSAGLSVYRYGYTPTSASYRGTASTTDADGNCRGMAQILADGLSLALDFTTTGYPCNVTWPESITAS